MNTEIQNVLIIRYEFRVSPQTPVLTPGQPALVSSLDYGFDFDGEALGDELIAPLPVNLTDLAVPDIAAEEFDARYQWFIS